MFSGSSVLRLVFWTYKSRRTNNPKLIRYDLPHPELRYQVPKRSYRYNLDGDHIVNKDLYWNQTEANRKNRISYEQRKARKFGVRPLVGVEEVQRSFNQIMDQLYNKHLIQKDPQRTTKNVIQVLNAHPQQALENKSALLWVVGELQKQMVTQNWTGFCIFCNLAKKVGYTPTPKMFATLYQHLYSAEALKKPLPLQALSKVTKYIFSVEAPENIKDLIFKNRQPLKFFQYNDPRPFSFQQLLGSLYSKQVLDEFVSRTPAKKVAQVVNGLSKLPIDIKRILNRE